MIASVFIICWMILLFDIDSTTLHKRISIYTSKEIRANNNTQYIMIPIKRIFL